LVGVLGGQMAVLMASRITPSPSSLTPSLSVESEGLVPFWSGWSL